MNIVIHTAEPLVFRDGRPFGDPGHVDGGILNWPWPSTVLGMVRTRVGLSRDENFFDAEATDFDDKIAAIKKVRAKRIGPVWRNKSGRPTWQYLFPAPADALVIAGESENSYRVHRFTYVNPFGLGGIDLPWRNWRIPVAATLEKPADNSPDLWREAHFLSWLKEGNIAGDITAENLGFSWPQPEVRMHTAIDPETGTVKTGQLFSSWGIRLATAENERQPGGFLGIGVELAEVNHDDNPFGPCRFGGERKTAFIDPLDQAFPECPDWFQNRRYLRLVLISPGDFGSWAPSWLMPDIKEMETQWCKVPNTDIRIRLCSAYVPRWQPVSGWDYEKRGPKATRKMVPAGAVYIIELQDPATSGELAGILWGNSIADNLTDLDGCGAVCVGSFSLNKGER